MREFSLRCILQIPVKYNFLIAEIKLKIIFFFFPSQPRSLLLILMH